MRDGPLLRAVKRVALWSHRADLAAPPRAAAGAGRAAVDARRRLRALGRLLRGAGDRGRPAHLVDAGRAPALPRLAEAGERLRARVGGRRARASSSSAARTSTARRAPATATTRAPACAATTRATCCGSRTRSCCPAAGTGRSPRTRRACGRRSSALDLTPEQREKLRQGSAARRLSARRWPQPPAQLEGRDDVAAGRVRRDRAGERLAVPLPRVVADAAADLDAEAHLVAPGLLEGEERHGERDAALVRDAPSAAPERRRSGTGAGPARPGCRPTSPRAAGGPAGASPRRRAARGARRRPPGPSPRRARAGPSSRRPSRSGGRASSTTWRGTPGRPVRCAASKSWPSARPSGASAAANCGRSPRTVSSTMSRPTRLPPPREARPGHGPAAAAQAGPVLVVGRGVLLGHLEQRLGPPGEAEDRARVEPPRLEVQAHGRAQGLRRAVQPLRRLDRARRRRLPAGRREDEGGPEAGGEDGVGRGRGRR